MKKSCLVLVAIAAIALVAIAVFVFIRLPIVTKAATVPLTVSITGLDNGGAYPVSAGLQLRGEAISGAPIRRIELWADGNLTDTAQVPAEGLYVFGHTWTWTPQTLGDHTLVVRAFDAKDQVSPSSVLHVRAIPDPGMVLVITAGAGDTLESLAHANGTTVEAILALNPGLDPKAPLSGDVFVPANPPAASGTSGVSPSQTTASNKDAATTPQARLSFPNWIRMALINPVAGLFAPAAPQLSATTANCQAQLTISDTSSNELGFFVYRLSPQTNNFAKIATLPGHAGTGPVPYTDSNLFGSFQYYVSAYDSSGEAASNYIPVNVTGAACSQSASTFALTSLVNFDASQADKVYLYMSVNQGNWMRVPQPPQTFLPPDTVLNLGATPAMMVSKPPSAFSVRGELWGWKGGTLVFLGSFDKSVTPPPVPPPLQLEMAPATELHVQTNNPVADASPHQIWVDQKSITQYGTLLFGWKSGTEEATSGRWEVSTMPFGNDLDLNPAGMVLNGDAPTPLSGIIVPFPIDLSSLAPASGQSASIGDKGNQLLALGKLAPYATPFSRSNVQMDPTELLPILFGLPSSRTYSVHPPQIPGFPSSPAAPGFQAVAQPIINSPDLFIRYNVRILPMNGEEPIGTASNTVFLDYYWQSGFSITFPPPPAKPYELKITAFQPPHFPLPDYEFCVQVVENPKYGKDQSLGGLYNVYNPNPGQAGNILCPKHWSGGGKSPLEQLADVLAEGLNLVSKIYKELGDFVVNVLDKVNPACAVSQDVCHAMDQLIVAAAKTYCGLPPSIPNYDELKSAGEDYVADLAADQMEGAGIPCPQACKDQIKAGIDSAFEQIKDGYNNSSCWSEDKAHQLGFEDGICAPEGVKTIPDPRGQYSDGVLTVEVSRKPGFKDEDIPPSCFVGASATAENDYWIGKGVGLEGPNRTTQEYISWKGTHLSGLGLVANGGGIPKLAEGQTISIPLLMRRPNNIWWIPGHDLVWKGFIPAPNEDDWAILYHGSMLNVTANSMCAQDGSNVWTAGPVIGPMSDPVP